MADLIFKAIRDERIRQEFLKRAGKFAFSCADEGISNAERLAVLIEELGEVAHEVNEGIGVGRIIDQARLRTELIQVAAVAVAWLEAIEAGRAAR